MNMGGMNMGGMNMAGMSTEAARQRIALVCALTATGLFCALAVATLSGHLPAFDAGARAAAHTLAGPAMTLAMSGITRLGSVVVLTVLFILTAGGLYAMGQRRDAVALTVVMAGAIVLNNTLKYTLHRARPDPFFGAIPETYSFPSGHALFSTCFYVTLAWLLAARLEHRGARVALWTAALGLPAAIGFSRVYLGVHYPTDVMAGYLVAMAWLAALRASPLGRSPDTAGGPGIMPSG